VLGYHSVMPSRWMRQVAALCFVLAVLAVSAGAVSDQVSGGACSAGRNEVSVASGRSPKRALWKVAASIRRNQSCRTSLEMAFTTKARDHGRVRWSTVRPLPAAGHVQGLTIDATDLQRISDYEGEFAGYTGAKAVTVVARMDSGRSVSARPQELRSALRKRFVWLRGLRYFVQFHSPSVRVKRVTLYDADGKVIYRTNNSGGLFF
jgi:hypothetical protein